MNQYCTRAYSYNILPKLFITINNNMFNIDKQALFMPAKYTCNVVSNTLS